MIISRWKILAALLLNFPFIACAQPNRFNVLFIAIDDLRPELGCYGEKTALSPHLDQFARESTLFTRNYASVPTCGCSRYAMLTGRSPLRTGVTSKNEALYEGATALQPQELPGAQSMPELFRRSGYHTVCIGKISHTPDGKVFAYNGAGDGRAELPNAWDELATPYGPWKRGWGAFFAYTGGRHREDGQHHNDVMEFTAERDEGLPDGLIAQTAATQLQSIKKSGQPFFLGVGFYKPHLPFVATRGDWDAFANIPIEPPNASNKLASAYWHNSSEFYHYTMPFPKTHPLDQAAEIKTRRAYFACVRYVDRQVGKVLQALQENGLAEKTIVIVWSDNGWHLGEQQIWGKHTPFERAVRTVLMIRAPGISKAGAISDAFVEGTDLYPTLVDWCRPGFTKTQWPLDGKSLQPIFDDPPASIHDAAISFWQDAITARTADYRLVSRIQGKSIIPLELYNLRADRDERTNVLSQNPEVVREISVRLRTRFPELK